MAQPPNSTDIFLREVDENLRRDQLRDFGKKYGGWLIAAVILFIAASGAWIYWQHRQQVQAETQVEELSGIYRNLGTGNISTAPQRLDALSEKGDEAIRASALFARAAVAIEKNDVKLATDKYREIATDDALPKPYRDLALIRQTTLEFDRLKPEEAIKRMAPLATPGSPWFGSAGEITAAALIKQGKKPEAGRLYAALAKDKSVPDALRARAVQLAASVGADVSTLEVPAQ